MPYDDEDFSDDEFLSLVEIIESTQGQYKVTHTCTWSVYAHSLYIPNNCELKQNYSSYIQLKLIQNTLFRSQIHFLILFLSM